MKTLKNVRIANVKVGRRFRKDMGDLKTLAADIKEQGLLVPIGVDPGNRLVMGERRLRACKLAGLATIPAVVIESATDDLALRRAEEAENNLHKPLNFSERVALRESIMKVERKSSAPGNGKGNLHPSQMKVNANSSKISQKAGFRSNTEYFSAKAVVESEDAELIKLMDASAEPGCNPEDVLTPFSAASVCRAFSDGEFSSRDKKRIVSSPTPRTELRSIREDKRQAVILCSQMTMKVYKALGPVNWITDKHAPDSTKLEGAFKAFVAASPMDRKVNKIGLPLLLQAVSSVLEAYTVFEKELKEAIRNG